MTKRKKRKTGFDASQHETAGRVLAGIVDYLSGLFVQISNAYGTSSRVTRRAGTRLRRATAKLHELRSEMENQLYREQPEGGRERTKVYYPPAEARPVCVADLERCVRCRSGESGYRRGIAHAFNLAGDMVRAGATADDLDILTDLAMDWRLGARPTVHVPEDLITLWRQGERGVTGLDARAFEGVGR